MKIGIDIGGSHVAVGIIDIYGKLIYKTEEDITNNLSGNYEKIILVNCKVAQPQHGGNHQGVG